MDSLSDTESQDTRNRPDSRGIRFCKSSEFSLDMLVFEI